MEEKLFDVLLDAVPDKPFTSTASSTHGIPHGRLSNLEQVMGRSASVQVQILLNEPDLDALIPRLHDEFRGSGLRYWASPLILDGEIQ